MTKNITLMSYKSSYIEFLCEIGFAICHLSMHKQKLISQELDETP